MKSSDDSERPRGKQSLTSSEVQWIEQQLEVLLPKSYKEVLLAYPFDIESFVFQHDLWGDHDTIVESNLTLRQEFALFWAPYFVLIGQDDVGGVFFIDARDPDPAVMSAHTGICADTQKIAAEYEAQNISAWVKLVKSLNQ